MSERLDEILKKLVDLAEAQTNFAIERQTFSKDLAEAVCIVLSMAYGRWGKK